MKFTRRDRSSGFTLLQISILLAVASIVMVSMLPGQDAGDPNHKALASVQKLHQIEQATLAFMKINGRRPCPADGQYAPGNSEFGVEAANPGVCTGGAPTAPLGPDDGTTFIVGGVVPTKALNLPDHYAFDEWGRYLTYVVDKRATEPESCYLLQHYPTNDGLGGIEVKTATAGTLLDNTMVAYLSHGADGHGAFPSQGSSVAGRFNSGKTDADSLTNAGVDSSFAYNTSLFTNIKVKKDRTATFDDILYYRPDLKNRCCIDSSCQAPPPPPLEDGFRVFDSTLPANSWLGYSLAAGDVNGDGVADILIAATGERWTFGDSINRVYVVYGIDVDRGFASPLDLASLDGTNGFRLDRVLFDGGGSMAVGDVNGDTIGDIILGGYRLNVYAPYTDNWYDGYVDVIFGTASPRNASYTLNLGGTLLNGASGFRLQASQPYDQFGSWVRTGDVNGDGKQDLIIASAYGTADHANGNSPRGYTDVVFGKAAAWPQSQSIDALLDGTKAFRLRGITKDDAVFAVDGGDLDGDGKDDVAIGMPRNGASQCGLVDIVFGHGTPFLPAIRDLAHGAGNLIDGWQGASLRCVDEYGGGQNGASGGWNVGKGLAFADIDDDGKQDLVVAGVTVSVVFGHVTPWYVSQRLKTGAGHLLDGTEGFHIAASAMESLGFTSALSGGDFNGDGVSDLVATGYASAGGTVYVIFGHPPPGWTAPPPYDPPVHSISLGGSLIDGVQGFRLDGENTNDLAGYGLAMGDVDGDGRPDVIIGAPGFNGIRGVVYVYYGRDSGWENPVPLSGL